MYLKNPFTTETRLLYMGIYFCWECGSNGTMKGGLELHHIRGRISASPLNSALLCHECHEGMCHNEEEERRLFLKTLRFLKQIEYKMTSEDMYFLEDNKQRLISPEVMQYIESL